MTYKRESFCGPAGDGWLSEKLSELITMSLDWLEVDVEESCHNHDIDWEDGPSTVDDIKFALNVYTQVREQKNPALAGFLSFCGFCMVRATAIAYKHF
jgi:hypothetical protein